MVRNYLPAMLLLPLLLSSTRLPAQTIDASKPAAWKTTVGKLEAKTFLGREALYLDRGIAYLPGSNLGDGTIEVDIAPTLPGFGGLIFHADAALNYEELYIRYVKSGLPDALQYTPVFKDEFSWQLYPEYQAKLTYRPNEWVHLKLRLAGQQAQAYFYQADTAAFVVDSLRVPNRSGMVGLWSLAGGAYFSNFKYTPAASLQPNPMVKRRLVPNPKAIRSWAVSAARPFDYQQVQAPDWAAIGKLPWQQSTAEPDGTLNLNRYATKQRAGNYRNNSEDVVWLRYEWEASQAGLQPLSFEFTNRCFVYCNQQRLFSGNNSFALKGPEYLGNLDKQLRANTLYLPVRKGKNTLMVAVSSISNGWGFIAQLADSGPPPIVPR
jgi:hypothetical protein